MGIPLQPVNLAPYRRSPMLSVEQIAQGMQNMRLAEERSKALSASTAEQQALAPSQVQASQARAALYHAQAQAAPLQAEAALKRAEMGVPAYGAVQNPLTGQIMPYNKYTGQIGLPPAGAVAQPALHPASHAATMGGSVSAATPVAGGLGGSGTVLPPSPAAQLPDTPAAQAIRNLMTGSRYSRGGTQSLVATPGGDVTSITSPTRAAQSAQQRAQMGEAAFSNTYPFMSEAVKNFGSSTYGAGVKALGKVIAAPPTVANAKKIAEFLAVDRLKPSIAGDLGRMTTGGTPAERTMAEYGKTAFAQLPSAAWVRSALVGKPQLAKMVTQYESQYYPQLEKEIQEARSRSLALQSRVPLGQGIQVSPLGQPIPTTSEAIDRLTPQRLQAQGLGGQQPPAAPASGMVTIQAPNGNTYAIPAAQAKAALAAGGKRIG